MRRDSYRAAGFVLLVVLGGGSLWALLPRLLDAAGGAEVEVAAAIKETEPEGLFITVPGLDAPIRSSNHSFSRVAFRSKADGKEMEVSTTLDFTGWSGRLRISSLGLERLRFRSEDGVWHPVDGWAPSLVAALKLLESRRKALEAGDISALSRMVAEPVRAAALADPALRSLLQIRGRQYEIRAWYLRFERDEVQVTEEGSLRGDGPDRPVDDRIRRRLHLTVVEGEFLFSPSLM